MKSATVLIECRANFTDPR